jgi:hypothetical protein
MGDWSVYGSCRVEGFFAAKCASEGGEHISAEKWRTGLDRNAFEFRPKNSGE